MKDLPQCPNLYLGAEVHYYAGMSNSEELRRLTVGNTPYILVEMPVRPWNDRDYRELEQIHRNLGLIPIIAHLDRYIGPFRTHGIPKRLATLPVLVQANAEFFLERPTSAMALRMLKKGSIHLLGSDCHNMKSRKPNLGDALEWIRRKLGKDIVTALNENAQMVLTEE